MIVKKKDKFDYNTSYMDYTLYVLLRVPQVFISKNYLSNCNKIICIYYLNWIMICLFFIKQCYCHFSFSLPLQVYKIKEGENNKGCSTKGLWFVLFQDLQQISTTWLKHFKSTMWMRLLNFFSLNLLNIYISPVFIR